MGNLKDLQSGQSFNYRAVTAVATTYTALSTDTYITMTGTYTITLPTIASLIAGLKKDKVYKIENVSGVVTIAPGTGDTINETTSYVLYEAGDYCIISISPNKTNWQIDYPAPQVKSVSIPFEQILEKHLKLAQLACTIASGATSGVGTADTDAIGGTILGYYPTSNLSSGTMAIKSTTLQATTGSAKIVVTSAASHAATFKVIVIAPD